MNRPRAEHPDQLAVRLVTVPRAEESDVAAWPACCARSSTEMPRQTPRAASTAATAALVSERWERGGFGVTITVRG